ncbi:LytR/AlgR family response regulator transcription factor [Herbidospora cretacea]|uniref:LytR/AlgR family response regulator transcription factor n=1 Tax=Herbidospora cretacea TaxID=28444 RepID=UPI000A41A40C|nr:LytTR family DNA-binding domain-containing protein [Herbidospora cretacea]
MCCFDVPFRLTPEAARAALPHLELAVGAPLTITSTTEVLAGRADGWDTAVAAMRGRSPVRAAPLTIMGTVAGALVAHAPAPESGTAWNRVRPAADPHADRPDHPACRRARAATGPAEGLREGTDPAAELVCDLLKTARWLSDQLELDHLRRKTAHESIPVELGGRTRFIDPGAVWFAEARGDYVRLRTADGGFLVRTSMAALERRWAEAGFIRAHRSTLVNARHVSELRFAGGRALLLVGTETLPVSRRLAREVRERLTARRA